MFTLAKGTVSPFREVTLILVKRILNMKYSGNVAVSHENPRLKPVCAP